VAFPALKILFQRQYIIIYNARKQMKMILYENKAEIRLKEYDFCELDEQLP
jgi:hypothetical protein